MARVASFTSTGQQLRPSGTLAELMARRRQLAERMAAPQQPIQHWMQGLGNLAQQAVAGLQEGRLRSEEEAGRERMAQIFAGINPSTGEITPEQQAELMRLDPDTGLGFIKSAIENRRALANRAEDRRWAVEDREDAQAAAADLYKTKQATEAGGKAFSNEQDLRKEYNALPVVKNLPTIQNALDRINFGSSSNNAVGDMAIVYGFMKLQDPESAVREGEYATAENARGVPDTVINLYNKIVAGERLSPDQRSAFVSQAQGQFDNYAKLVEEANTRYGTIGKRWGIDTADLLVNPRRAAAATGGAGGGAGGGPAVPPAPEATPAPEAPAATPAPDDGLPTIHSPEEYSALPPGAKYHNPGDPHTYTKPNRTVQ